MEAANKKAILNTIQTWTCEDCGQTVPRQSFYIKQVIAKCNKDDCKNKN
jgi:hypothetical protein